MVATCWVNGCNKRKRRGDNLGFYSIPVVRSNEGNFNKKLTEDRRRLWLSSINRKDPPTKHSKICSVHFLNGKPASMYDRSNPGWVFTLNLDGAMTPTKSLRKKALVETGSKRYSRLAERHKTKERHQVARVLLELQNTPEFTATPIPADELYLHYPEDADAEANDPDPPRKRCSFILMGRTDSLVENPTLAVSPTVKSVTTPIVKSVTESQVNSELQRLLNENMLLKSEINSSLLNQDTFKEDDDKVRYYTGLPNYLTFMVVVDIVSKFLTLVRIKNY